MFSQVVKTKKKKETNIRPDIPFVLLLFFLVYNPPLLPNVNFKYIISFFAFIYILTQIKSVFFNIKKIKPFILILFISLLYYLVCICINLLFISEYNIMTEYFSQFVSTTISFLCLVVDAIFIVYTSKNRGHDCDSLIKCFIYACLLQSLISVAAFIFPEIKSVFTNLAINNLEGTKISRILTVDSNLRYYGFADNLYDSFGYSMAIMILITFIYAIYHDKKYIFLALIFFFTTYINARTGVIISLLGGMIILLTYIFSSKNIFKFYKVVVFLIIILFVFGEFFEYINYKAPRTAEWSSLVFTETKNFFSGNQDESGIYATLFSKDQFWFFPNMVQTVFGAGSMPDYIIGRHSDLGVITNIWCYGVMGSLFFYTAYIWLFIKAYQKPKGIDLKLVTVILFISFILYLFKLNPLGMQQAGIITVVLTFQIIINEPKSV